MCLDYLHFATKLLCIDFKNSWLEDIMDLIRIVAKVAHFSHQKTKYTLHHDKFTKVRIRQKNNNSKQTKKNINFIGSYELNIEEMVTVAQ